MIATLLIAAILAPIALAGFVLLVMALLGVFTTPKALGSQAQSLFGGTSLALADQPAALPWVASIAATVAGRGTNPPPLTAADWYDPTTAQITQTFNEFGFITSPSPAPVNPKTGAVPMTNLDVCNWMGHAVRSGTCPRCGTIVNAVAVNP